MENRSTICKISTGFAICCGVLCALAVAPLVVAAGFAIFAFLCLLCCVLVLFAGIFVWLFTVGQANIFHVGTGLANFGTGIFHFIGPVTKFSFAYITPTAGGIALAFGILGIIIASVELYREKHQPAEDGTAPESAPEAPALPEEPDGQAAPAKKKKTKKRKTDTQVCVSALIANIILSVIAIVVLIVAAFAGKMF